MSTFRIQPLTPFLPSNLGSFPNKISSIYSCHTMIELRHIKECKHVPKNVRDGLEKAKNTKQHTGAAKQFYEASAHDKGMVDTAKGVFWSKDGIGSVVDFSSPSQSSTKKKSKKRVTGSKQKKVPCNA